MTIYEDECVGCPTYMGCLGQSCPNRNVPHIVCDHCRNEDKIYEFDGEELCIECIIELLKEIKE